MRHIFAVLCLCLMLRTQAHAALGAPVVWEVRTTGADTNGGGFSGGTEVTSPGTDFSQQNSAQVAYTDLVIGVTTTQYTSVLHPVGATLPGNVLQIISGTGCTPGFYEVLSNATITATVDRSMGTAASVCTANLGGALASPGMAGGAKVQGNDVFVKSGTYTISNTTINTSGGPVKEVFGSGGGVDKSNYAIWHGYGTVRTDSAAKPKLQVASSGVTGIVMFLSDAQYVRLDNFEFDGAGKSNISGAEFTNFRNAFTNLLVENTTTVGIGLGDNYGYVANVRVTTFSGVGIQQGISAGGQNIIFMAEADHGTGHGFVTNGWFQGVACLSHHNTGGSTDGFSFQSTGGFCINCVSAANGRYGIDLTGNASISVALINFLVEANASDGIATDAVAQGVALINSGGFNNGGVGNYNATNITNVVGTAAWAATSTFFVDITNSNFALNNLAGGGALARTGGLPGTFLDGLTTGYAPIGAAVPQCVAGVCTSAFTQ